MSELERHYKISKVAEALGISRKTLWQWVREGKVRAVRVGKLWVIPESEVKRLMGK